MPIDTRRVIYETVLNHMDDGDIFHKKCQEGGVLFLQHVEDARKLRAFFPGLLHRFVYRPDDVEATRAVNLAVHSFMEGVSCT